MSNAWLASTSSLRSLSLGTAPSGREGSYLLLHGDLEGRQSGGEGLGERARGASSSHDKRGSGPVRVSVSVVITEEIVLPCLLVPGYFQWLVHRGEQILTQGGNLHGPGERDGGEGEMTSISRPSVDKHGV